MLSSASAPLPNPRPRGSRIDRLQPAFDPFVPDVQPLAVGQFTSPCERLVAVDNGDVFVVPDAEAGGDFGAVGEVVAVPG
jgi:hypothetical protein